MIYISQEGYRNVWSGLICLMSSSGTTREKQISSVHVIDPLFDLLEPDLTPETTDPPFTSREGYFFRRSILIKLMSLDWVKNSRIPIIT